jgi:hypothetical protein
MIFVLWEGGANIVAGGGANIFVNRMMAGVNLYVNCMMVGVLHGGVENDQNDETRIINIIYPRINKSV